MEIAVQPNQITWLKKYVSSNPLISLSSNMQPLLTPQKAPRRWFTSCLVDVNLLLFWWFIALSRSRVHFLWTCGPIRRSSLNTSDSLWVKTCIDMLLTNKRSWFSRNQRIMCIVVLLSEAVYMCHEERIHIWVHLVHWCFFLLILKMEKLLLDISLINVYLNS